MLEILEQLGPWVSYPPRLAKCLGGVKEAIFLTHILWWKKRSEDGWVFRTREDIERDTGLSRWEQETARRNLRQLGVLREEYRGIPRRLFFYVDMGKLDEVWKSFIESSNSPEPAPMPVGRDTHRNASYINAHQQVGDQTQIVGNQKLAPSDFSGDLQLAGGNTSDKQVEIPPTSRLDSRQQAGGNTSDYLVISKEGNNKKRDINNMIDRYKSNDSRIHEQEPTDIRKVLKQSQPSESNTRPYLVFESPIVRHLIELGFPRKSLRSEDDRKELDEILAKCDENVSVMLQKLETLAKERHIRLYEYGGKISLQKLRERWDDLTVEVQFSPEMADWHYREYAVYCIRNNYDDRQIVMMAKGFCYCYSLPRSEVYNVAKKLRQIIEELLREKKRRENVRPNLGIDYGSLVQKFPT